MNKIKLKYKSRKNKYILSKISYLNYKDDIKQMSKSTHFDTNKLYILPIIEQSGKFYSIKIITDKATDIKRYSNYTNIYNVKSLSKWRLKHNEFSNNT